MAHRGRRGWIGVILTVGTFLIGSQAQGGPPVYQAYPQGYGRGPMGPQPMPYSTVYRSAVMPEQVHLGQPPVMVQDKGMVYHPEAAVPYGPAFPGPGPMHGGPMPSPGPIPREKTMTTHPAYTVAPPDVLLIDALRLIPRPPYRVEPLEVLLINVTGTLPNEPIMGQFVISPEGTINLGFGYGAVRVGGMTLDQIHAAIRQHLAKTLANYQVTVTLAQFRGLQQIRGEHLVRPDGTVNLGVYGCAHVAGLNLCQIKEVVEKHLSQYFLNPEIAVDVLAYNSQVYYVIIEGGSYGGQQIYRYPITGNETVLDAISSVRSNQLAGPGLPWYSSRKHLWLARPAPCNYGCSQILPIDWNAITQAGSTCTNYQILPGDRIFVKMDPMWGFSSYLTKLFAPVNQILSTSLYGANLISTIQGISRGTGSATGIILP